MALRYWPEKKGIDLNNEVANLFLITKKKLSFDLFKQVDDYLYIDILDNSSKKQLFIITLNQLEILILDIIELDLNADNIELLNYRILHDLIRTVFINFLQATCKYENYMNFSNSHKSRFFNLVIFEHKLLLGNLLIYLLFGSSQIDSRIYPFNKKQTPKRHVSMLLENFVLQVSNLVTNLIFENITSLTSLVNFLSKYNLCSSSYLSARSAATLLNNLILQNLVYLYIKQPRDIYSSRYKILLIHQTRLQMKYIYACRSADIRKLSSSKYIFISFLEIQDLLIPKLEKNLLILCKILLYVFINIIGSSIIFIIRIILSGLNGKL